MKWLHELIVDENILLMTVNELRAPGYDVMDIKVTNLKGIDDARLWGIVIKEKRLLIETDKGFI